MISRLTGFNTWAASQKTKFGKQNCLSQNLKVRKQNYFGYHYIDHITPAWRVKMIKIHKQACQNWNKHEQVKHTVSTHTSWSQMVGKRIWYSSNVWMLQAKLWQRFQGSERVVNIRWWRSFLQLHCFFGFVFHLQQRWPSIQFIPFEDICCRPHIKHLLTSWNKIKFISQRFLAMTYCCHEQHFYTACLYLYPSKCMLLTQCSERRNKLITNLIQHVHTKLPPKDNTQNIAM